MTPLQLIGVSVVIGANNFSAALALGALGMRRRRWRIAPVFGAISSVVVLVGLVLGRQLSDVLATAGQWIGVAVLAALGAASIRQSHRHDGAADRALAERATGWRGLVGLALGLSGDNLAVGFVLGLQTSTTILLSSLIGVAALLLTLAGLQLGAEARRHWAGKGELGAGVLLVGSATVLAGLEVWR